MNPPRRKPAEDMSPVISLFSVLFRQFGAGIAIAGVFAIAVNRMYEDLEKKNETLIALVREQSSAAREVAEALRELTESLRDR